MNLNLTLNLNFSRTLIYNRQLIQFLSTPVESVVRFINVKLITISIAS